MPSSMHVTGNQLGQLTGIAAVLRFPLPELAVEDDDSDEVNLDAPCCLAFFFVRLAT